MFSRLDIKDRDEYIKMATKFYDSDAVIKPIPIKYIEDTFDEMMRSDTYCEGYIFKSGAQYAGYGVLSKTYSQEAGGIAVWVEELYFKPEFRGNGLATEFFEFLKSRKDIKRLRIEAEPDNTRAISLYKRIGFSPLKYAQLMIDFE